MLNISGLYDEYFTVVPADTPELLDEAHALRYQVYCVEHPFENPAEQQNLRERDRFDQHSVHAVLIYKPSRSVVGCVRLILPDPQAPSSTLPIRALFSESDREQFDRFPRATTAEISRYAVSKAFRRREGEDLYPDVNHAQPSPSELRRLAPHISLGLIRGVARLAADQGMTTLCAAMAPSLLRLLERFGLKFDLLGPPIEYHGLRQPCIAECQRLLEGMAAGNTDYYHVVKAEFSPKPSS